MFYNSYNSLLKIVLMRVLQAKQKLPLIATEDHVLSRSGDIMPKPSVIIKGHLTKVTFYCQGFVFVFIKFNINF